jgi:hypothetical protein
MVMPCYEGVTLAVARQAMARPPDEAWLRDLLLPLLGAVDVLHGASCYHLNISPENILLLPDGRPVLLDLGAARYVIGDRTQALAVILKSAFAPIEQFAESTKLRQGPWTNLYALAAVAYYCVSGHAPVASTVRALDDQMEPLFQVVDRLGRSFPELNYSVAFVSAIERALNVRPQERPQSVAEFRRALLGGRGAAESVVVPPPVEEAEPHGASPPLPSSREESGPFQVFLSASDGGHVEDASRKRSEPRPPKAKPSAEPSAEPKRQTAPAWGARTPFMSPPGQAAGGSFDDADDAALRAALETALRPNPEDFDGFPQSGGAASPNAFGGSPQSGGAAKAGGWRRTLFLGVVAVALVALGAGGWMLWSDYRDMKVELRSMALGTEPQRRTAPLLPPQPQATVLPQPPATVLPQPPATVLPQPPATVVPQPPAESPAPVPSGAAAEPRLPPPATAPPEAAPGEPPAEEEGAVAEAPAERAPPESPAMEEEAPSPPPPAKVVKKEPDNPRVLCGPRTQFSLYRCMKEACDRSKYFDHPECKYLRVTDEVRALP